MIKKVQLLLVSIFGILFLGFAYANPIALPDPPDVCSKFKNVEIDNYKIVVGYNNYFYEPKAGECIKCKEEKYRNLSYNPELSYSPNLYFHSCYLDVFLLDKSIDIKSITEKDIKSISIPLGNVVSTKKDSYDETKTYKITNKGGTYSLVLTKTKDLKKLREFPIFRLLAIIIETLVIFYLAKLFRKENRISNRRLLYCGIIPTTITLPLLRFFLPLILGDGIWYIIIGESLVIFLEAIMLKYGLINISRKRVIFASILCNVLSFSILSIDNSGEQLIDILKILGLSMSLCIIIIFPIIVKIGLKKDDLSNTRLITVGIIATIGDVLAMILLSGLITAVVGISHVDILALSECLTIGVGVVVPIVIIKYGLKISRKDSIVSFLLLILSFVAIGFILKNILFIK